jgi:hypothetical protein
MIETLMPITQALHRARGILKGGRRENASNSSR